MIAHRKCRQKSQRSGQLHSPKCVWLIFVDHLSEINPYSIATKTERGQIHFEVALNTVYGTIHLRHRKIFTIFDPYPPPVGSFLLLSVGKFGQFLTPSPLKNDDVLKMDGPPTQ